MLLDQTLLSRSETAPYADVENEALIARCLAGEEVAYVALYNLYAGMIYRLVYSMLQDREDAEEVLQDSFEYAFRKLGDFDPHKSAFKTWLYRIAISRCHNKRRRKWLPTFSLSHQDARQAEDQETPTPDDTLRLTETQQAVWRALQQLSPKLRETAVLRYYEGLSYQEIGDILGIPGKTAESRMRLAHQALKEMLQEVIG
ncbi:MAG: RNA polymerase sigma factor [Chloroflexi bacterium]|nr:RNA polymerase sigma factor [Ardenticatenaceae bacterium]MBL1127048.1 RNA polymerase sigma factor [Chloroflexota bacterium]NOG33109.1 RNA polymerase sigma factor [Chloroflexota bacterium]GIK54592.1 MAG: RNA polymerase subunit sigma-24 [Chloroflexota bacterium]